MAKAIRWQVPFTSIGGTHYRVDIYDEGYTGSPVQLYAGEQPFVTEEDSSEDYFAPIRTQTGTLQVCTALPDGGRISLDELLPASNIARPVRLINLDNSNAIEWQGFLSCESYSQNYTAIPENLSLPVISVLEAMDSVEIGELTEITRGNNLLYQIITQVAIDCGIELYTDVAYSRDSWRVLWFYFPVDLLYKTQECSSEGSTIHKVVGLNCKKVLSILCTFMGWTCREQGTTIFFQRIGEESGMYKQSLSNLNHPYFYLSNRRTSIDISVNNMISLVWRGTDHKRDIRQGAKSVVVVAKIEDYGSDLELPDYPGSDPTEAFTKAVDDWNGGNARILYIQNVLEQNGEADNLCTLGGYYYGKFYVTQEGWVAQYLGTCTKSDFQTNAFLRKSGGFNTIGEDTTHYSGATFIRYGIKESPQEVLNDYEGGLYCVFLQGLATASYSTLTPIFKLRSASPSSLYSGKLHISSEMIFFGATANATWLDDRTMTTDITDVMGKPFNVYLKLNVGSKWWDGSQWATTETAFLAEIKNKGLDLNVPVTSENYGLMELSILPGAMSEMSSVGDNSIVFEAIFKSLKVEFEPTMDIAYLDRDENRYAQQLNTKYRDEISIDTDIATYNFNKPSPSLLVQSPTQSNYTKYAKQIQYETSGGLVYRRPEVDLLNRLATYYGAARQRLELEVAHPTAAPLPLLKLNGINDGKVYLPLSESRDWQTGVCKLTCFETPT